MPGLGVGHRGRRHLAAGGRGHRRDPRRQPDRRALAGRSAGPSHRRGRAGSGARRGPGARLGRPARRRARRRQVHPVARSCAPLCGRRRNLTHRHRRGIHGPGAHAGRADQRRASPALPRRRERPRRGADPRPGRQPRAARRRLGADHLDRHDRWRGRRRAADPRGRGRADRLGQGAWHGHRARRSRHQGRRNRRAARARAPGRRRAALRGRSALVAAARAGDQEPLRRS